MNLFWSTMLVLLTLIPAAGCSADRDASGPVTDGAAVEEDAMPESYEQRTYAARKDADRGDTARQQMERTDEAIRRGGEEAKAMLEGGKTHMKYTRPVLQEPVMRDGFTGAVIR